ncbi:MAG: hypothetical protein RIT27_102 [Pseudomonadota bacterium]
MKKFRRKRLFLGVFLGLTSLMSLSVKAEVITATASVFTTFGTSFSPLATTVGTSQVLTTMSASSAASVFEASGLTAAVTTATAGETVYSASTAARILPVLLEYAVPMGEVMVTNGADAAVIEGVYSVVAAAQTGVVLDGLLTAAKTGMTGGAILGLLYPSEMGGETIYDPVTNTFISLAAMKVLSSKPADYLSIVPISTTDSERRIYQMKAANLEGCPQSSLLPAMAYCIDGSAVYTVSVFSYQDSYSQGGEVERDKRWTKLPGNQIEPVVTSYIINDRIWSGNYWGTPIFDVNIESWIVPNNKFSSGGRFKGKFTYKNSQGQSRYFEEEAYVTPVDGVVPCPIGTKFSFNLWTGHVQVCEPDFSQDLTKTQYANARTKLGTYPHYETYPDGSINVYPIVQSEISKANTTGIPKEFSTDSQIADDQRSVGFSKPANQYVDGKVQVATTPDSIVVSKTLNNFKMKHRDGTDFMVHVREVSKYSMASLTLVSREVSYESSDGTKLKPDDTFLSPDTFGSPDLALSPRFNVDPFPKYQTGTGTGTGTQTGTGTGTQTGSGVVPCGLGQSVTVFVTNADGTSSSTQQPSPPCQINWGAPRDPSKVKELPTKEPIDFKAPFQTLRDHFGTGNWFPVSSQCSSLSVDLSQANVFFLRPLAKVYELPICDWVERFQEMIRLVFSIGWFFASLWVVLDA